MTNKERSVVTPGETIVTGLDFLPGDGTYRDGENINSAYLGLSEVRDRMVKVIPLSGSSYVPREGDRVIGVISEVRYSSWNVDIGGPYGATLLVKEAVERYVDLKKDDLTQFFDLRDAFICKVRAADPNGGIMVSLRGPGLKKLNEGRIIEVDPAKVPRIIGRNGSMVSLIKEGTDCQIFVGQNGRVWVSGPDKKAREAIKAIKKVEAESHVSGLTEEVRKMLGLKESPQKPASKPRSEEKPSPKEEEPKTPQKPPVPQGGHAKEGEE